VEAQITQSAVQGQPIALDWLSNNSIANRNLQLCSGIKDNKA
jgi:hypothetical protein